MLIFILRWPSLSASAISGGICALLPMADEGRPVDAVLVRSREARRDDSNIGNWTHGSGCTPDREPSELRSSGLPTKAPDETTSSLRINKSVWRMSSSGRIDDLRRNFDAGNRITLIARHYRRVPSPPSMKGNPIAKGLKGASGDGNLRY